MNESRWWNYVQAVAGDVQAKEIADAVGIDKSNVTRWKQGSRPAVEFVLKFARAYGRPVVEALAESGFITDEEAGLREVKIGTADLTDVDLARELLTRIEKREATGNLVAGRFGVRALTEDEPSAKQPPAKQRTAARKGVRKADAAPHAE